MLRPAGPRISSMMPVTRSIGRYWCNSRSVASKVPISAPEADIRETNSSSRSSTTSASTVPRVDMWIDNSRTSSSSSKDQTLPPYFSPSASIRMAARFGPANGLALGRALCRLASEAMTVVMSLVFEICGTAMSVHRLLFAEPLTNDGSGLVGIALGEFAYPVHGLRMHLALDLGDVDQLRSSGVGKQWLTGTAGLGSALRAAVGQRHSGACAGQRRDDFRGQDALDQRTDHHEQHHEAEQHHDGELDAVHNVVLGELQHAEQAGGFGDRRHARCFGEAQVDDLDLVAALLVEADRRAHQGCDAIELLLAAVLIDHLAFFAPGIAAVDQHDDRNAVDPPGLGDLGLGGARDLVVVGFFALLALVARSCRVIAAALVARQLIVDGDLAVIVGRRRGLFAGLAGT